MAKTSMFTRARLQLPLTPSERAFLKFLQGLVPTVLISGLLAAVPFLQSQTINWRLVITTALVAMGVTLFNTLAKYFTAQGDNPAASLAGDVGAIIQHALPQSAPAPTPAAPPTPAIPVSNI